MNWTNLLKLPGRGSFKATRSSPFSAPAGAPPPSLIPKEELQLAPDGHGLMATVETLGSHRPRRSWFGWLLGRNRRRDAGARFVQGELLLQNVRPLRNDFRDEAAPPVSVRLKAKVLYETPPTPERRDDQDHAWNRLRNRRPASLVVKGE
jgi:hypothetical protein